VVSGRFNTSADRHGGMDAADRFFLAVILLIFGLLAVGTLLAVL
jgi:hypothetical protein